MDMVRFCRWLAVVVSVALPVWANAQMPVLAAGKVVDAETGLPVAFATVTTCEGRHGVLTDSRGVFELPAVAACPQANALVVRSVGYTAQTVALPAGQPLTIRLVPREIALPGVDVVETKEAPLDLVLRAIRRLPRNVETAFVAATQARISEELVLTGYPRGQQESLVAWADSGALRPISTLQLQAIGLWRTPMFGKLTLLGSGLHPDSLPLPDCPRDRRKVSGVFSISNVGLGDAEYPTQAARLLLRNNPIRVAMSGAARAGFVLFPVLNEAFAKDGTWRFQGMDTVAHAPGVQLLRLARVRELLPGLPMPARNRVVLWVEPNTYRVYRMVLEVHMGSKPEAPMVSRQQVDYALQGKRLRLYAASLAVEWYGQCDSDIRLRFVRHMRLHSIQYGRRLPRATGAAPQLEAEDAPPAFSQLLQPESDN